MPDDLPYADTGPLPFERRRMDRWAIAGHATAFRIAGPQFGSRSDLTLIDYSDGGVAAVSDTALEPGAMVSLGFEPNGMIPRRGVVRRCQPCGNGYRIGIQFEQRMAA